jgi:hypothetical protein
MNSMPFNTLPEYPDNVTPGTILAWLANGTGFRFRWATEGLTMENLEFHPTPAAMSIGEVIYHIYGLLLWVHEHIGGTEQFESVPEDEMVDIREDTLHLIQCISKKLMEMDEKTLASCNIGSRRSKETVPFWHIINGPMSDILTHIGQINSWRRLAGNPTPLANVFRGQPPK